MRRPRRRRRAHGKSMGVGGVREDFEFQTWLIQLGMRYLTGGSDVGYILSAGRADVKRLRAGAAFLECHDPRVPSCCGAWCWCPSARRRRRRRRRQPSPNRAGYFASRASATGLPTRQRFPSPDRRFLGAWTDAAWDANTCAALVVDDVKPDGTASIIYVYGPLGPNAHVAGGVLHGTGVIRDDELRFQNSDGTQFAFRPAFADLVGNMTTPKGQTYQAAFKKTF